MYTYIYVCIYISAGPLVGHTAVEAHCRYSVKYQVYKYRYQVSGVLDQMIDDR